MSDLKYSWAENPSKLKRAIMEVEDSGKKYKGDEEEVAVKIVYRRLLGRVIGEPARGSAAPVVTDLEEQLEAAREEGRQEIKKEYDLSVKEPKEEPKKEKADK